MTLTVWTTNYPTTLDTVAEQPIAVNTSDDVDQSHVNVLSQVVQNLQTQIGSNITEKESLRSKMGCLQQGSVQLTWTSITIISIAAWSGTSSTQYFLFQDGKWRSFTGTLTFNPSTTGEGGLDTGVESDAWYYLYLVPTGANDNLLTVRGSINNPLIGPNGYPNYKYIGAVKNLSGNLLTFYHVSRKRFYWGSYYNENGNFNVIDTNAYPLTLNYVPWSASAVDFGAYIRMQTIEDSNVYIWTDNGSLIGTSVSNYAMLIYTVSDSWGSGERTGLISLNVPQSLYVRFVHGPMPTGVGTPYAVYYYTRGWIDSYLF